MYKPSPFVVAMELLVPTYTSSYGVAAKTLPTAGNGIRINGSFKTYGGTERDVNGAYVIEDTATVETWYRPDIVSGSTIRVLQTGALYEVIGEPENIELRNQFLKFKVKRLKGGA